MKDLLAIITPALADRLGFAAQYTIALASRSGAHSTALVVEIEAFAAPPIEPDNMQARLEATEPLYEGFARTKRRFEDAAKLANVPITVLREASPLSLRETLIANAQVRDLVAIDVLGPLQYPRQGAVEAVLFATGRPIMLVPSTASSVADNRALLAWDGTRAAVRALHDALPLLVLAREVMVVSVTDDKEFRAADSGVAICRYLGRWGIPSHFQLIKRDGRTVGVALLEHASQVDSKLLVMGGFGHAREREFVFGSATRDIFQATLEIAVLLSH